MSAHAPEPNRRSAACQVLVLVLLKGLVIAGRTVTHSANLSPRMDPRFRSLFNAQFTPAHYHRYRTDLESRLGCTFEFRLAESPVFLTDDFKRRATESANAIVEQLSD